MNRKILLSVFILVAVMQLYVPGKMIFDNEDILETGIEYKFKTAPIDPSDPFRENTSSLAMTKTQLRFQME